jgi:hypothetical protein
MEYARKPLDYEPKLYNLLFCIVIFVNLLLPRAGEVFGTILSRYEIPFAVGRNCIC